MIVKIWPIKVDYANDKSKVGGVEGMKNALEYITDSEKVIAKKDDLRAMEIVDKGSIELGPEDFEFDNKTRVLNYMSNEEKIEGKYISGYLCDPDTAIQEFNRVRETTLAKIGRTSKNETGAVAFHMVQSFPEGLEISDEEVHQCGIELCERINAHQAVICSHVHPMTDEDGEVHGKCKHNHILLNAYIHPDKLDPEKPDVAKYNDCKESYGQLRVWNDEIAIMHGLPIIRNPDDDRVYSWKETESINRGLSWKQRVRLDIEDARRASTNMSEFQEYMESIGYTIKNGSEISYYTPDKKHRARGKLLGRQYTKQSLELYWKHREFTMQDVQEEVNNDISPPLLDTVLAIKTPLRVAIPLGMKSHDPQQYYYLPLEKVSQSNEVLATYFNENESYDICDENNARVNSATGREILDCIEMLRDGKENALKEQHKARSKSAGLQKQSVNQRKKDTVYFSVIFINTQTKKPYGTSLYDKNGRRRSMIELIFRLALTVLNKEDGQWDLPSTPPGKNGDPIYAPRSWRIQNMIDSIYLAQEENIETPAQLDARLNEAGSSLSRARSALKSTTRAKEKMETLRQAVAEYRKTAEISQQILDMPEGPEKEEAAAQYKAVIDRYIGAKAVLYRYQVTTEDQIIDFEKRYLQINLDIEELESHVDTAKEEYRRLSKLKHNVNLAQNTQYCYGPAYSYDLQEQKEKEKNSDDERNKRTAQTVDEMVQKGTERASDNERDPDEIKTDLYKQ